MAAVTSPPVRVHRAGWLRLAPLTREQVRRACLYAEAWVRQTTWKDAVDLMHALAWCVIDQVNRPVSVVLAGVHDIDDMPVIRMHVGEIIHHIAVRDTRMVANNTADLLLSEDALEIVIERRMQQARERAQTKDKVVEKALEGAKGTR